MQALLEFRTLQAASTFKTNYLQMMTEYTNLATPHPYNGALYPIDKYTRYLPLLLQ